MQHARFAASEGNTHGTCQARRDDGSSRGSRAYLGVHIAQLGLLALETGSGCSSLRHVYCCSGGGDGVESVTGG